MTDEKQWRIVTHGGVGTPNHMCEGCIAAVKAMKASLAAGDHVLDCATKGTVVLEDDPRYNAGVGSNYRLDGKTIEMDAAVMDDSGRMGMVAALQRVRNPVLIARQIVESPHVLLSGRSAQQLARKFGHEPFEPGTERSREKFARILKKLSERELPPWRQRWLEIDLEQYWNFDLPYSAYESTDTVGCVVTDGERFATGLSTGGASPMLAGRIGDTPLPGTGFWVGDGCAVTSTGVGEEIIRKLLSKWIWDRIVAGEHPQAACEAGIALYPASTPMGAIALTADAIGAANNQKMAWAAWTGTELIDTTDSPEPPSSA